jgi:hypothetical protein
MALLDVLDWNWLHTAHQGWFCLARARYQMGAASVSQLQYDQNMSACVVLQPCTSDSESLATLAGSTLVFSTHSTHLLTATGSDAPTTWALHRVYEPEQDHASTLRRRKTASDATDAAASRMSSLGQLPAAPLRWFAGAMPPVVLKAAQQHFWRGAGARMHRSSVSVRASYFLMSTVQRSSRSSMPRMRKPSCGTCQCQCQRQGKPLKTTPSPCQKASRERLMAAARKLLAF